jgi:hypothetical protein
MSYVAMWQVHVSPVDSFARKYNAIRASGLQDE